MKNREWCDHPTMAAVAEIYQINIHVHVPHNDQDVHIPSFKDTAPTLHLSYHNLSHYNLLREKKDGEEQSASQQSDAGESSQGNDAESSQSSSGSKRAGPFLYKNLFGSARSRVELIMMVPFTWTEKTLSQIFERRNGGPVFLIADYTENTLKEILSDIDLARTFRVFVSGRIVPLDPRFHDRYCWLANLIVSYIENLVIVRNNAWKA